MFPDFLLNFSTAANKELFHFSKVEKKEEKQPPRFQLSSLSPQERIDYSQLIEELGESWQRIWDQILDSSVVLLERGAFWQQRHYQHINYVYLLLVKPLIE